MHINFWYWKEGETKIAAADCLFYPHDGEYRGNVYNAQGRAIGDYTSKSSVDIEKRFPGIFGN